MLFREICISVVFLRILFFTNKIVCTCICNEIASVHLQTFLNCKAERKLLKLKRPTELMFIEDVIADPSTIMQAGIATYTAFVVLAEK